MLIAIYIYIGIKKTRYLSTSRNECSGSGGPDKDWVMSMSYT